MNRITILISGAIAAGLTFSSPATAQQGTGQGPFTDEYRDGRICYVESDPGTGQVVAVLDTWEPAALTTLNAGTTSGTGLLGCIPTDCPAGLYLVSGNICSDTDPFGHIPYAASPSRSEAAVPAVAVPQRRSHSAHVVR